MHHFVGWPVFSQLVAPFYSGLYSEVSKYLNRPSLGSVY